MKLPLDGMTVVDFSQIISGPYCSANLADWGARVIRVEQPGGDEIRKAGPPFAHGEGTYYLSVNRNKESISIDLRTEEGRKIAHTLCQRADVVMHNFTPSVPAKLGIDYETIKKINSNVIYISINGFGESGPYRDRPGLDLVFQGLSGMMSLTGPKNGPPMRSPITVVDMATGLYASYAVMLALLARERGQGGRKIEISMLDVAIAFQSVLFSYFFATGQNMPRLENQSYTSLSDCFETKDGYINISIVLQKHWESFCKTLNLDHLINDDRFKTAALRLLNQEVLHELVSKCFKEKTTAEWLEVLTGAHLPCGPVHTYEDVMKDPQVIHDNIWLDLPHVLGGTVRSIAFPVRFGGWEQVKRYAPPRLGEDTRTILSELGYNLTEIEALIGSKIVFEPPDKTQD